MLCLCLRPFNVNNVRMMFGARTVTMRVVLEVLGMKEWDVIEVTVNEPPIPFRIKHVREQTILFPPWQRHKPVISSRWLNETLSFRTHYCIHAINSLSIGNNPRKNYRFNCLKGSICPELHTIHIYTKQDDDSFILELLGPNFPNLQSIVVHRERNLYV